MSMKTKAAILVTSFAVLLFVVVGSLGGVHASSNDGSYRQLQVYSEVLSRVRSEYVEEPNIPKVTDGALHGLLESLDSNSSYMSADAYKVYKAHKTESKGGIGAVISKRFGYAAVVAILPGSPAEKAGIEQTDIFESIEGQSTREMSLPEIRSMIAGTPGSTLNVAVVRARKAEPQKVVITRDVVSMPAVADKMMDDGIGYLRVEALSKGKTQEIASKIKALEHSGRRRFSSTCATVPRATRTKASRSRICSSITVQSPTCRDRSFPDRPSTRILQRPLPLFPWLFSSTGARPALRKS